MWTRATPIRDPSGQSVEWYGSTTDIHNRKLAEEKLARLNTALEQTVAERTLALREREQR